MLNSLLALHSLASQSADGLRPELVALLDRLNREAVLAQPLVLKVIAEPASVTTVETEKGS